MIVSGTRRETRHQNQYPSGYHVAERAEGSSGRKDSMPNASKTPSGAAPCAAASWKGPSSEPQKSSRTTPSAAEAAIQRRALPPNSQRASAAHREAAAVPALAKTAASARLYPAAADAPDADVRMAARRWPP